jgi:excisionase family DNA binding protein
METIVKHLAELPPVLTAKHVQAVMGISRMKAYELMHRQGFPVLRIGRCMRVPRDAFVRWMEAEAGGNRREP